MHNLILSIHKIINHKNIFLKIFILTLCLSGFAFANQLEKLKEEKLGYEMRYNYHINQAEILQFNKSETLLAKKHWFLAKKNKEIALKIQKKIDALAK